MSETLRRRLIDQIGDAPTFVADGSRLTGDIETAGPLVVCGAIRGDGRVGGRAAHGSDRAVGGRGPRPAAVIAGKVTGKLVVEEKLEIGATAVIRADIVARSIAIAKGAVIEGR